MSDQLSLFTPDRLPHRPYCTNRLQDGLVVRGVQTALEKRYIQANPHCLRYRMVFDIDRADAALDWMGRGVAAPSWCAENPENDHAHLSYEFEVPICTSENARTHPLRYAAAIEREYQHRLEADLGYSGLIVKNPEHPDWRLYRFADQAYSLGDLARHVNLDTSRKKVAPLESTGLGRNVVLFDDLRHWAYRSVDLYRSHGHSVWYNKWMSDVEDQALHINIKFREPLAYAEVRATAKSIAKWVWQRFWGTAESNAKFSKLQAHRGSLKGKARRDALLPIALKLHNAGKSFRAIGTELGVDHKTVLNWVKSEKGGEKP